MAENCHLYSPKTHFKGYTEVLQYQDDTLHQKSISTHLAEEILTGLV